MDRHSVQTAIAQTLENYQRCGLRWIIDGGEYPSEWNEGLECLQEEATATVAESGNAVSSIVPHREPAPVSTSTPSSHAAKPQTLVTKSTVAVPSSLAAIVSDGNSPAGSWQNAELDDGSRQNLFQILDQEIRSCRKCVEICPYRRQTVFGEGPIRPTVCFFGEAPGADEDAQGRPFVGRAGQLLTKIIGAMQLKREDVYILNALKCRPPGNRTPTPQEILNCSPFAETQLETLRPKYIVCLGAVAVRSLLKVETPVGQMRGRFYQYFGAKVLVTYHPSYLLRNEDAKRLVWEDMQMLMAELGIQLPKRQG